MSIRLMTAAWSASLPTIAKFVLVALCDQANDQGECWPTIETIGDRCSIARSTVLKTIGELQASGFVARDTVPGKRTYYLIADPSTWRTGPASGPVHDVDPSTKQTRPPNGRVTRPLRGPHPSTSRTPPVHHVDPHKSNHHLTTTNQSNISAASVTDDADDGDLDHAPDDGREFELLDERQQEDIRPMVGILPSTLVVQLAPLADYLSISRANGHIRKPGFHRQLLLQLIELQAAGEDVNAAICEAIEAGEGDTVKPAPPPPPSKRGTRLQRDWKPSAELLAFAKTDCPSVDTKRATDEFRDYWCAVAGQKGCKLDWDATWRNRMRELQDRANQRGNHAAPRHESASERVSRKNRERREERESARAPAFDGEFTTVT